MNTTLVYPFPIVGNDTPDARNVFTPFAERFVETYLKHPPGGDHELLVMFGGRGPEAEDLEIFKGIPNFRFALYTGGGIDIGSAQRAAHHKLTQEFIVGMTSRVYFHREGALKRLIQARWEFGRGLYGSTGSYEGCPVPPFTFPNPHMRTVWYGMDRDDFRDYPYEINSREDAHHFEAGKWNYMRWFQDRALPVRMVDWSGMVIPSGFRNPAMQNCFRRGDQSDCLVFDKHSDAWRDAGHHQRKEMSRAAGDVWL